jgi:hypothetical protein
MLCTNVRRTVLCTRNKHQQEHIEGCTAHTITHRSPLRQSCGTPLTPGPDRPYASPAGSTQTSAPQVSSGASVSSTGRRCGRTAPGGARLSGWSGYAGATSSARRPCRCAAALGRGSSPRGRGWPRLFIRERGTVQLSNTLLVRRKVIGKEQHVKNDVQLNRPARHFPTAPTTRY